MTRRGWSYSALIGILAVSVAALTALSENLLDGRQVAQAAGSGTTYYVSTTGDDASPGTADAPFRTLDFARRRLAAGDTLAIYGGTYRERLLLETSGTASGPITVRAVDDEKVILDTPSVASHNINLEITGSYNQVSHLEVRNSRWSCVVIRGSHNVVGNLRVSGCMSHGIIAAGTRIRVENSEIFGAVLENASRQDGSGWGSALKVERNADYVELLRNKMYHNYGEGIGITMGNHVTAADNFVFDNFSVNIYIDNSSNVTIERNLSSCTAETGYQRNGKRPTGIALAEEYYSGWGNRLSNVVVRNNLVAYCGAGLAYWGADQGTGGLNNVRIEHNTFYGGTEGVLYIADEPTNTQNAAIERNLFSSPANQGPWVDEPMRALVVFRDNFWVGSLPGSGTGALGEGDVAGDPAFVTTPAYDSPESFALTLSSAALGKGADPALFGTNACHGVEPMPTPTPEPTPAFEDVPPDHWAFQAVQVLFERGFVVGCSLTADQRLYCPESGMTRGESAVFVERGLHGGQFEPNSPGTQVFQDVDLDHWYAGWANALWLDGLTAGCGIDPLQFCGEATHTRAEASVFFLRMLKGAEYVPELDVARPQAFGDVPIDQGLWFPKWVYAAYDQGLLDGCGTTSSADGTLFRPHDSLTRAEAACMMVHAKGLE